MEASPPWQEWIASLGHDTYAYPPFISRQQRMCKCQPVLGAAHFAARPTFACLEGGKVVDCPTCERWREVVDLLRRQDVVA